MKYLYKIGIIFWFDVLLLNFFWINDMRIYFFSGYLLLHCILCEYYPDDKITHFFQKLWAVVLLFITFVQIMTSYPGIVDLF